MVTVNFKLIDSDPVQLPVNGPETFEKILQRCAASPQIDSVNYIAIRNNTLISLTDLVEDLDEIDIFPAIAGG